jgi:hypothetical protein
VATTTTSPNDAFGIVWAIGVFFFLNFSCFFFYFSCFFSIVDLPALNHVFWLPPTRLNTPSTHFDTHHIQTTHFGPHRPNEGHRRPTTATNGQRRPTMANAGQTKTNEGPRTQGLRNKWVTSPNDARHVVWAQGTCFVLKFTFFIH